MPFSNRMHSFPFALLPFQIGCGVFLVHRWQSMAPCRQLLGDQNGSSMEIARGSVQVFLYLLDPTIGCVKVLSQSAAPSGLWFHLVVARKNGSSLCAILHYTLLARYCATQRKQHMHNKLRRRWKWCFAFPLWKGLRLDFWVPTPWISPSTNNPS